MGAEKVVDIINARPLAIFEIRSPLTISALQVQLKASSSAGVYLQESSCEDFNSYGSRR